MPYQLPAAFSFNPDLQLEQVNLNNLADTLGTPFYAYSQSTLLANVDACIDACQPQNIHIHYAMKANSNLSILKLMAGRGLGVDIVSGGELSRALAAGFSPEKVVFSGVGKTDAELRQALRAGIGQINIESVEEYQRLSELCAEMNCQTNAAVRVNPEVTVDTHRNITTGSKGNKFGVAMEQLEALFDAAKKDSHVNIRALAMHIGSQIKDPAPYGVAIRKLCQLATELNAAGNTIELLDLGGGFGIDEGDGRELTYSTLVDTIIEATAGFNGQLAIEPGRSLVANTGVLVTEVVFNKQAAPRNFLILDAAMNDLMRPALYQAVHPLQPVAPSDAEKALFDVVGPVCESTDTFAREYPLPADLKKGDRLVFGLAGAYSAVMSNGFNSRALVAEVMIDGDNATLIRPRLTPIDQMQCETTPQPVKL